MKILCTGISGSNKLAYLKAVGALFKRNNKALKIYSVGEIMREKIESCGIDINYNNILNMDPKFLSIAAGWALEAIAEASKHDEYAVINTHTGFLWKGINIDSNNSFHIPKINPDFFITMIAAETAILENLKKDNQWKSQTLSEENVLHWQDDEVEETAGLAKTAKKEHFVFPMGQTPETLYKKMVYPQTEVVYVSFPMTHLDRDKGRNYEKIDHLVKELRRYFCVIDPRNLTINEHALGIVRNHTVHRDLHWFVSKTHKTIIYYPEITFSLGANTEMWEACKTSKDVYAIFPSAKFSPFLDYPAKRIFRNTEEFYDYLAKNYKKIY